MKILLVVLGLIFNLSFAFRQLTEEVIQTQVQYFYRHMIDISIGSPPQLLKVKLSSSFCGLWIHNINYFRKGFNFSESSTFVTSLENGEMEYVKGTLVRDTVNFISIEVPKFPFLLVDTNSQKEFNDHQGVIGFGYHCDMTNKATTDALTLFITHSSDNMNQFWFRLNKEDGKGRFAIGEQPKNFEDNPRLYHTTPIDRNNQSGQWKINLNAIYFEDGQIILIKDKISIGIGGALLSVTYDVFIKVASKYFKELVERKECEINMTKVFEITCNPDITRPEIGYLSFIVDKWNFKVDSSLLFINIPRNGKRVLWFALVHYPEHNEFYISQLFIPEIYIIYNKAKGEIGLFKRELQI